jgi:hypothetical protein
VVAEHQGGEASCTSSRIVATAASVGADACASPRRAREHVHRDSVLEKFWVSGQRAAPLGAKPAAALRSLPSPTGLSVPLLSGLW